MRKVKHLKKEKGFTLLELMVVIAIVGTIVGLAAPNMAPLFERARLKDATEEAYFQLYQARSEAISRQQDVLVVFSVTSPTLWAYGFTTNPAGCDPNIADPTAANACFLVTDDGDGNVDGLNGVVDTDDRVLHRITNADHPTLTFAAAPDTGNRIVFNGLRGTAVGDTGAVTFTTASGLDLRAQVLPLGSVLICTPTGNIGGYGVC